MQTVGFIGVGKMGGPVAGHIQRAGFPMIVHDLRAAATRPFRERGAVVAASETFPLKLLRKDVGLATVLGRELNVPLPLASINEQKLTEAMNRGWGDLSAYTVSFQLQEEAAQVQLRANVDPIEAGKYISTHPNLK